MEPKDVFEVSDPREYIQELNEDPLIEKVIIPLYQKRDFILICRHPHGPGESGKDIIFRKIDIFPKPQYHAIQAKAVDINVDNVSKTIDQARAAFNVSFRDPYLNVNAKVDFVEVITSGKASDDAKKQFYDEVPDRRHITLIENEQLLDMIEHMKKDFCAITHNTSVTSPKVEIPSNVPPSTETISKIEESRQLPWDVIKDLEDLKEKIKKGKLPEDDKEITRVIENRYEETLPLEAGKGHIRYFREFIQRDTTRISIIPNMPSLKDSVVEAGLKARPYPSLKLPRELEEIFKSLSKEEKKIVDILNYCNGIDETTLKCIMTIEDLDITALETITERGIITYNKENLNIPENTDVEKIIIIEDLQNYLQPPTIQRKEEIFKTLTRALNVCDKRIPFIFLIIDEKYEDLNDELREEVLKYILQIRQDISTNYFLSRFSHKDVSLIEKGKEILDNDIDRKNHHRTYFNIGSALLLKNTKDGIIVGKDTININEVEIANNFFEIACDMDRENAQYLAALSISLILRGDLDEGILNAQLALNKNEQEPNALNAISLGYIFKGNLNTALPYLEKLIKLEPDIIPSLVNLGSVYKGLKKFDKALEIFEKVNQTQPENDLIIAEIGVIYQNLGNVDNALKNLDRAIELNSKCELAWLGKGDVYFNNLRDYNKAIEFYEKAIQINKNNPNGLVAMGLSYDRLANHEKARFYIDKAIEKNPSGEFALLGFGEYYANRGMFEECEQWCGKIIKDNPMNVKAIECIGIAYLNAKKYNKAIEFFDKALEINPVQSNILYAKAVALTVLKKEGNATILFEKILKLDPNNIKALIELSKILSNNREYKNALELLSQAEKVSPKNEEILSIKGIVYANKKDYLKAIEILEESLELNPKDVNIWLAIGRIYVNTFNNFKAKQYFEKGLEIEDDNLLLLESLGVSCLNLGLFNEAIRNFKHVLKLGPSNRDGHFYIAEAYKLKREFDKSVYYYDKLLNLEPENKRAILGLSGVHISSGDITAAKKLFKSLMRQSEGEPQIPFDIGIVWANHGRFKEAIKYMNKAIDANPKKEFYHIVKGNIHLQIENYNDAISSYKKALKINPNNSEPIHQLGITYLNMDNVRKAIEFLEKYTTINPNNASGWASLGIAYNKFGDKARAKECLENAILNEPLNANLISITGDMYKNTFDDHNSAINYYKKAISLGREDTRIKIVLASCYLTVRKFDECIKICKDILKEEPKNLEALVFEGISWLFKRDFDKADKNLRKASALYPNSYLTYFGLSAFHNNSGETQEAIEWAKRAIEKEPNNSNNVTLYVIIGNSYNLQGKYEEAIKNFEHAKSYKPDFPEILRLGGFAFRNSGRHQDAIKWWEEYLKIIPNDWEFWYYLGATYGEIHEYENGIKCLEKAISLKPSEKAIYYTLGKSYTKIGNHQIAIQTFQKIKTLNPESSEPWLLIGDIYFNVTNEFEKAIQEYLEAMKINPENWKAWANLSFASKILGDKTKEKEYLDKALQQCPDKLEIFQREIDLFLRLNRYIEAMQTVENALNEYPKNHILWFLKACVESINMDIKESIKALENAINLENECIFAALTDSRLDYLRKQEVFSDLMEKYKKNLTLK